jgi:hypothetical protein
MAKFGCITRVIWCNLVRLLANHGFTREFSAFTREFTPFTREFGAFTREFDEES